MLQTPSQTVGPFFAYGLTPEQYLYDFKSIFSGEMTPTSARFQTSPTFFTIAGRVLDGEGKPIPDALIEVWQNDGEQQLFGRFGTGTDPENRFIFHTVKPQPIDGQAPFLTVVVFMRGQLIHSFTRVYFPDEAALNEKDEVLNSVPAERRHTLLARKNGSAYQFDIHMQGEQETVFFEV